MESDIMDHREAAKFLRVSEHKLYQLARSGEAPSFRVGALYRYRRSDLEAWIATGGSRPSKWIPRADDGASTG